MRMSERGKTTSTKKDMLWKRRGKKKKEKEFGYNDLLLFVFFFSPSTLFPLSLFCRPPFPRSKRLRAFYHLADWLILSISFLFVILFFSCFIYFFFLLFISFFFFFISFISCSPTTMLAHGAQTLLNNIAARETKVFPYSLLYYTQSVSQFVSDA